MIPTYKDILTCHTHVGHIDFLVDIARELGYSHIMWNDRVFRLGVGFDKRVTDTGLTINDIK